MGRMLNPKNIERIAVLLFAFILACFMAKCQQHIGIGIGYIGYPVISADIVSKKGNSVKLIAYDDKFAKAYKMQSIFVPKIPLTKQLSLLAGIGPGIGFWKPDYYYTVAQGEDEIRVYGRNSWRTNPIVSMAGMFGLKYGNGRAAIEAFYMPSIDIAGNTDFNLTYAGVIGRFYFLRK